jgi:hypothetical protein
MSQQIYHDEPAIQIKYSFISCAGVECMGTPLFVTLLAGDNTECPIY